MLVRFQMTSIFLKIILQNHGDTVFNMPNNLCLIADFREKTKTYSSLKYDLLTIWNEQISPYPFQLLHSNRWRSKEHAFARVSSKLQFKVTPE